MNLAEKPLRKTATKIRLGKKQQTEAWAGCCQCKPWLSSWTLLAEYKVGKKPAERPSTFCRRLTCCEDWRVHTNHLLLFRLQHLVRARWASEERRESVLPEWFLLKHHLTCDSPLAAAVKEVLLLDTWDVELTCWFWEGPCKCMLLSRAAALLLRTWFIRTVLIPAWPSGVCCHASACKLTVGPWACSDQCTNQPVSMGEWGPGMTSFSFCPGSGEPQVFFLP